MILAGVQQHEMRYIHIIGLKYFPMSTAVYMPSAHILYVDLRLISDRVLNASL